MLQEATAAGGSSEHSQPPNGLQNGPEQLPPAAKRPRMYLAPAHRSDSRCQPPRKPSCKSVSSNAWRCHGRHPRRQCGYGPPVPRLQARRVAHHESVSCSFSSGPHSVLLEPAGDINLVSTRTPAFLSVLSSVLLRAASALHLVQHLFRQLGLKSLLLAVVFQLGWRQD